MPLSVRNPLITVENNIYPTGGKDRTGRAENSLFYQTAQGLIPFSLID